MLKSFRTAINTMPLSVKPIFAILLAVTTAGLFFFIGFKIELAIFHIDVKQFSEILNNTEIPIAGDVLRIFMALQTIALFAIPPIIIVWCYNKKIFSTFLLQKKPSLYFLFFSIILVIVANPFINLLLEYNGNIVDTILGTSNSIKDQDLETQKLVETLLKDGSFIALIINTIVIAFLPAALEELFFRGFIQNIILPKFMNIHWAIFCSAFLFSFIHFQFYGFIPRMVLGVIFGYVLLWSGSLWVTIGMHFANNFMAVLGYFFISHKIIPESLNTIGTESTQWIGYTSAIIICGIIALMYKKHQLMQRDKSIRTSTLIINKSE